MLNKYHEVLHRNPVNLELDELPQLFKWIQDSKKDFNDTEVDIVKLLDRYTNAYSELSNNPTFWNGTSCLNSTPRKVELIQFRATAATATSRKR